MFYLTLGHNRRIKVIKVKFYLTKERYVIALFHLIFTKLIKQKKLLVWSS
jgi:hypothetical protein